MLQRKSIRLVYVEERGTYEDRNPDLSKTNYTKKYVELTFYNRFTYYKFSHTNLSLQRNILLKKIQYGKTFYVAKSTKNRKCCRFLCCFLIFKYGRVSGQKAPTKKTSGQKTPSQKPPFKKSQGQKSSETKRPLDTKSLPKQFPPEPICPQTKFPPNDLPPKPIWAAKEF